jgi:cysteine desulfurase
VLRALGREDELAHSSIRFTLGRFTTEEEIDYAIKLLHDKIGRCASSRHCGRWCRKAST